MRRQPRRHSGATGGPGVGGPAGEGRSRAFCYRAPMSGLVPSAAVRATDDSARPGPPPTAVRRWDERLCGKAECVGNGSEPSGEAPPAPPELILTAGGVTFIMPVKGNFNLVA